MMPEKIVLLVEFTLRDQKSVLEDLSLLDQKKSLLLRLQTHVVASESPIALLQFTASYSCCHKHVMALS